MKPQKTGRLPGQHRTAACRPRGERGSALVEFAMVVPLLLVLVFGIVDFGRAFQSWIGITNAAREGARLGVTGATTTAICSRVDATDGVSGASCSVTGAQGTSGNSVTVTVSYNLQFITPVGSLFSLLAGKELQNSYTLTTTADMRLE